MSRYPYNEIRLLYGATSPGQPLLCTDLLWRTGFQAPDPFFLCEFGAEAVMLASMLEYERAKKEAKDCRVELLDHYMQESVPARPAFSEARPGGRPLDALIGFLKKTEAEKIIAHPTLPFVIGKQLSEAGFTVLCHESGALWYPHRAVKTGAEIAAIVEVQRKAEEALAGAMELLRNTRVASDHTLAEKNGRPLTAERVREFLEQELLRAECFAVDTIVACGDQAVDPHGKGLGPLKAHLPIVIDIFPRSKENWYWADMSRTFFKGAPSQEAAKMYQAVLAAQRLGIAMLRPGVDGSAIQNAVSEFFEKGGYRTGVQQGTMQGFIHSVGHGVGLDIHEAPFINKYPEILPEGAVVTVEPGLYYLGIGGVRIEDMFVVERDGSRCLTSFPKELEAMIIP